MNKSNSKSRSDRDKLVEEGWNDQPSKKKGRRRKKSGPTPEGKKNPSYSKYMKSLDAPNIITQGANADNDPSWYMHLDHVARDYATLPFSQTLGLPSEMAREQIGSFVSNGNPFVATGIMTIYFEPTIGMNAAGPAAAVNLAAQQLYTLTRRQNSGAKNYDKTDLMMLVLAMDSAYMLYEDLLRAYRVLSTYNGVNRYYPNTVLNAFGYDQSLQYQLAEFRGVLDMFAYKLASVNIPDQLDLIKRHSWMCSNVYLDDDHNKAQSYAFVPSCIYVWREGATNQPTYLQKTALHTPGGNAMNMSDITTLIDVVMGPILGSEDVGNITGDMLKAFGEAGMIKIQPVEDYAALVPVYSQEVSLQIRNIFCSLAASVATPSASGNIEQVLSNTVLGPYLKQNLTITATTADGSYRKRSKPILNFVNEDTSPENVLVATRLITLVGPAGSGSISPLQYYGTENVIGMRLWTLNIDGTATQQSFDQDMSFSNVTPASGPLSGNVLCLGKLAQFHNAPAMYMYMFTEDTPPDVQFLGTTHNLCNYLALDDDVIRKLHEVATMSLFTVKDYKLN